MLKTYLYFQVAFLVFTVSLSLYSAPPQKSLITFNECLRYIHTGVSEFHTFSNNHLRLNSSLEYEVLVHEYDQVYKIKSFKTLEEANYELSRQKHFIDWELFIKENTKDYHKTLDSINELLSQFDKSYEVDSRIKEVTSLKNKVFDWMANEIKKGRKGEFDLKKINDLLGTRIIVNNNEDRKQLAKLFYLNKRKNKKLINIETHRKTSGYRANHIDYIGSHGRPLELQILTKRMKVWDSWNHDLVYKSSLPKNDPYLKKLKEYGKKISDYIQYLDNNQTPPISYPDYQKFGVNKEDALSLEKLVIDTKHS